MYKKNSALNYWFVALVSAFLIGLLPLSNRMSVAAFHVEKDLVSELTVSLGDVVLGSAENQHTSSELCCSACCPFCIFIVVQFVSAIPYGDNVKVVNSNPVFQAVYIKSIIPPPKA
jgi:hypothetical protein